MTHAPFIIYADMETMIADEVLVKNGKTISKRRHVPTLVGALTVCKPRPEFGNSPFLYTGTDCVEMLMTYVNEEVRRAQSIYDGVYVPCWMSEGEKEKFHRAHTCEMCHRSFDMVPSLIKVRDHCHLSGGTGMPCVQSAI